MLAEKIAVENDRLRISGWLSTAMSVNLPMHIPGVGNFLLSHVENQSGEILMKATESKQPELNPEAEVDMLDAEQTFPTEEESQNHRECVWFLFRSTIPLGSWPAKEVRQI